MSGAVAAVRGGVLAALRGDATLAAALNGVFDGPVARASAPYAEVGEALATDCGTKGARGRELRIAVLIRDAGERPERLGALAEAAEVAVDALPRALGGWRVASVAFQRARIASEGQARWVAVLEWRVRVLAEG